MHNFCQHLSTTTKKKDKHYSTIITIKRVDYPASTTPSLPGKNDFLYTHMSYRNTFTDVNNTNSKERLRTWPYTTGTLANQRVRQSVCAINPLLFAAQALLAYQLPSAKLTLSYPVWQEPTSCRALSRIRI